jgi:hypothetical protein
MLDLAFIGGFIYEFRSLSCLLFDLHELQLAQKFVPKEERGMTTIISYLISAKMAPANLFAATNIAFLAVNDA